MLKKSLIAGLALGVAFATTAAMAQDPLSIVYIGKNTGNPYFDSITGGFEDACASLGCEFEFVAPATAEATSQIPFIEAQIQRGVDVIAIAPEQPRRAEPGARLGQGRRHPRPHRERRPDRQRRATATRPSCRSTSTSSARTRSRWSAR